MGQLTSLDNITHLINFKDAGYNFSKKDRQSEWQVTLSLVQPLAVMYMVPAGQTWAQETENLASFGHLFPSCLLLLETYRFLAEIENQI